MQLSQLKAGQLDAYLESLTPKAAAFLIREVERDKLRGGDAYPHDLILKRVRGLLRAPYETVRRSSSPERLFCAPFDDMLVDVSLEEKYKARIRRSSADSVWKWLADDIAPDAVHQLVALCENGEPVPDDAVLADKIGPIYADLAGVMDSQLAGLEEGSKVFRRIAGRLGGEAALEDAREIGACLAVGGDLLRTRARLPEHIREILPADIPLYVELCKEFDKRHPVQSYMLAASILKRTARVSDALRVSCSLAGSQEAVVLESHSVSAVFDAVTHDIGVACDKARRAITTQSRMDDVEAGLKTFHALASALEDVVDLAPRCRWSTHLVGFRARLSDAISDQIAPAPRLVKTALFPKAAPVGSGGADNNILPPDERNVADAEFAVRLLVSIRFFLDQLSINAEYSSVRKQVEQFMEAVGERILRELRREGENDRKACIAYMEAAGRMIQMLFGEEAGTLFLRRGRAAAGQNTDAALTSTGAEH